MSNILVQYCSNYNGCHVQVNGSFSDDATADAVTDAVCDHAIEQCGEDGQFYGDIEALEEFAIGVVRQHYGADVVVTFEEDSLST